MCGLDRQALPGSLYGAIARLESRRLIEALEAEDRRNPYQPTAVGEKALLDVTVADRLEAAAV